MDDFQVTPGGNGNEANESKPPVQQPSSEPINEASQSEKTSSSGVREVDAVPSFQPTSAPVQPADQTTVSSTTEENGSFELETVNLKNRGRTKIILILLAILIIVITGIILFLNESNTSTQPTKTLTQLEPTINEAAPEAQPCPTGYYDDRSSNLSLLLLSDVLSSSNTVAPKVKRKTSSPSSTPITPVNAPAEIKDGCKLIHTENLEPQGQQCELISSLRSYPEKYRLNPETERLVRKWQETCNQPVSTQKCLKNQIIDSSGQCVCKANYSYTEAQNACVYNCEQVQQEIMELRSSNITQSSPEAAGQLALLENEAEVNSCVIPEVSNQAKKCENYQAGANAALAAGKYVEYFNFSEKYIEQNCSGKGTDICLNRLAKANLLNGIFPKVKNQFELGKLKLEYRNLKESYYNDASCDNVKERCDVLEPLYGTKKPGLATSSSTSTTSSKVSSGNLQSATSDLVINSLSPKSVFRDDKEYYDKYCTCEKVLIKYADVDLVNVKISPEEQQQLETCLDIKLILNKSIENQENPQNGFTTFDESGKSIE